ncbi:uncharacterized protein [Lolium perenne]|uniref:uncharacterized protein isoform X1 n=1 Tax=Lolium perenne TaxID=4522 RepID=UPI003A9A192A
MRCSLLLVASSSPPRYLIKVSIQEHVPEEAGGTSDEVTNATVGSLQAAARGIKQRLYPFSSEEIKGCWQGTRLQQRKLACCSDLGRWLWIRKLMSLLGPIILVI